MRNELSIQFSALIYLFIVYRTNLCINDAYFFIVMDDDKSLNDYGLTSAVAKAQQPAEVGLAFRGDEGGWEEMEKTPYSTPPELPDVMKPGQDSVAQEQTVA